MIKNYGIIKDSAMHISEAANRTCESLEKGLIEQETHFTDRMLASIEEAIDGFEVKGVDWRARTFTDYGNGSQDKRYDADFLGALEIKLNNYHVKKGFLAKTILIEPDGSMRRPQIKRLQKQLENLLTISPASFLFIYSKEKISVVPALSVVNSDINNPHELYNRGLSSFFMGHFESFIGDKDLYPSNMEQFNEVAKEQISIRRCLHLSYGKGQDYENRTLDQFI